ncbi:MAG: pantetheine-phosphate adenylyltransferase [Spirochaetes bacterium GWF1_41_5]|nr:MAG: pantetheine-phosphate adenylyltransferase [Spirochaetes bacterium GWF1_41_5]HBE03001.1 pantetheine-phosphate adenylyltransferase [Spirochaetia bacterium]
MKKAIFPGSFDPFTIGHYDILKRAAGIFDHIVVAIGNNPRKITFFSAAERRQHIETVCRDFPNAEAAVFEGLLINYVKKENINIIVRGLRVFSDFEYELQIGLANKDICDTIETVFMLPRPDHIFISSSMVKEIGKFGGEISKYLPQTIYTDIARRLQADA